MSPGRCSLPRENKIADVLVTVLVTGAGDVAVRDALAKAGLSIKDWSKSLPIVVGPRTTVPGPGSLAAS